MKSNGHFENQLMIILIFARNAVSHLKSHSQVSLSFVCLPSCIAKLTFKQNSKIRASIVGLQKFYSQFLETNKVFKAKRQPTQRAPGWAIPSASLLGQVRSPWTAPSPDRRAKKEYTTLKPVPSKRRCLVPPTNC